MKLDSKSTLGILLITISILTLIPFIGLTDFHTKGEPREAIVAVSMLDSGNWILPENNGGDMAYTTHVPLGNCRNVIFGRRSDRIYLQISVSFISNYYCIVYILILCQKDE